MRIKVIPALLIALVAGFLLVLIQRYACDAARHDMARAALNRGDDNLAAAYAKTPVPPSFAPSDCLFILAELDFGGGLPEVPSSWR